MENDEFHWMLILLRACQFTSARFTDQSIIIGEEMNDDDRRLGIRDYFSDCDTNLDDETVELILAKVKNYEEEQEKIRNITDAFLGSLLTQVR